MDPHFRTKTGTCTITPTRIVLARTGLRGALAQGLVGGSVTPVLVLYGIVGVVLLGFAVHALWDGNTWRAAVDGALGTWMLTRTLRSRNNSAAPEIERASIRSITAHPPIPPLTRGYFTVRFDAGGREQDRLILLPGVLAGGAAEYARALAIFRTAGLL